MGTPLYLCAQLDCTKATSNDRNARRSLSPPVTESRETTDPIFLENQRHVPRTRVSSVSGPARRLGRIESECDNKSCVQSREPPWSDCITFGPNPAASQHAPNPTQLSTDVHRERERESRGSRGRARGPIGSLDGVLESRVTSAWRVWKTWLALILAFQIPTEFSTACDLDFWRVL